MNIIVSIVLGLLFADIAMVFASMAITSQWRYFSVLFSSYAPMWAVQAPALGLMGAVFIAIPVSTFEDLDSEIKKAKNAEELSFIEVKCSIGARDDLGRPTTTALENKQNFMKYISEL